MPPNKKYDCKVELLRSLFRNMYLKEKCDYLDSECKMLAEQIVSCQVVQVDKTEAKTILENELEELRERNDQKLHELALVQEKIDSLSLILENTKSSASDFLNEKKSTSEDLGFKEEMIKCLQEELVHARLAVAEQCAAIRELKQIKDELENDKDLLLKYKPETISRLQDNLIQAKLTQHHNTLEFQKIKEQLRQMKKVSSNTNHDELEETKVVEGNVQLFFKGVIWNSNEKRKTDKITEITKRIKKLEDEKTELQNKLPDLHNKIEVLSKHIQFKENEKRKLQQKLNDGNIKHQSTENIILERRRQFNFLESSAKQAVTDIRKSINEKNESIDELSNKLAITSERKQSYGSTVRKKEVTVVQNLEDKICFLENRIKQLKSETIAEID